MENISVGDSVTFFADGLFGFLHGAASEDESLWVQPLEQAAKHRPGTETEVFQVHVRHDYDSQDRLQRFLQEHSLQHPTDAEKVLSESELQELSELQGLAESEMTVNSENQLFQIGRPIFLGQVFQLLHLKTGMFASIETTDTASNGFVVRLSDGGSGSHLRMRTTSSSSLQTLMDQDRVWIESANCGKAISCSRTTNIPLQGAWRTMVVNGPKEALHFTLSLRWKARPAVSGDGTQWASLAQASSQARGMLEGARESAEKSRSMLVHELAKVDSAMGDTQRGFDETVLMVMLHFQNLHQALEARENDILSRARALHAERCGEMKQARDQLETFCVQAEQSVELANRILGVHSEAELLHLVPHAQRKLDATCTAAAACEAMGSRLQIESGGIGFSCSLDDSLLNAISVHGDIKGMNTHPSSGRQKSPDKSLDHGLHPTSRAVLASGLGRKTMKGTNSTLQDHMQSRTSQRPPSATGVLNNSLSSTSSSARNQKSDDKRVAIHERMTLATLYRQCTPLRKYGGAQAGGI